MKQRGRLVLGVALAAIVAGLVIWRVWFPGRVLDPVAWRDDAQVGSGARLEMADRLVAQGTLRGKTRAEVVKMLGEPPPTAYFHEWDLVYWLGPERGYISIDSEWLVFRLDEGGRVAEYRIARD